MRDQKVMVASTFEIFYNKNRFLKNIDHCSFVLNILCIFVYLNMNRGERKQEQKHFIENFAKSKHLQVTICFVSCDVSACSRQESSLYSSVLKKLWQSCG